MTEAQEDPVYQLLRLSVTDINVLQLFNWITIFSHCIYQNITVCSLKCEY